MAQTETSVALLSADTPQEPVTRTQYCVSAAGDAVYVALVAPEIGSLASPDAPSYH